MRLRLRPLARLSLRPNVALVVDVPRAGVVRERQDLLPRIALSLLKKPSRSRLAFSWLLLLPNSTLPLAASFPFGVLGAIALGMPKLMAYKALSLEPFAFSSSFRTAALQRVDLGLQHGNLLRVLALRLWALLLRLLAQFELPLDSADSPPDVLGLPRNRLQEVLLQGQVGGVAVDVVILEKNQEPIWE